jgi:hypothetical protein
MTTEILAALRARVAALAESGALAIRVVDDDDPVGLAEVRYELGAEGHHEVLAALAAGEVRYAFPVVTWRGQEYAGGTCLVAEGPNPHDVLTPVDAVVDSFLGGQLDAIYDEVRP